MAESQADVNVTSSQWIDLAARYPSLANAATNVQNKGPGQLLVFFSSIGTEPTDNSGWVRGYLDDITGTAPHIWVKGLNGPAAVACGLTDS